MLQEPETAIPQLLQREHVPASTLVSNCSSEL